MAHSTRAPYLVLGAGLLLMIPHAATHAAATVTPSGVPNELQTHVADGSVTFPDTTVVSYNATTLSHAPHEVVSATYTHDSDDPAPSNYDAGWGINDRWGGAVAIKPTDEHGSLILGSLFRSVIPTSITIAGKIQGTDFKVNETWGEIANIGGSIPAGFTADYDYVRQRLDLIQVSKTGTVSIKKGTSEITSPRFPEPDADNIGLAGVYIHTCNHAFDLHITAEDIFVIDPAPAVQPINYDALTSTRAALAGGSTVTVAFFGDSITGGAEAGPWWFTREPTMTGLFMSNLIQDYPSAELYEVDVWQGGVNSTHDAGQGQDLWNEKLKPLIDCYGADYVWWEAESAYPGNTDFPDPTTSGIAPGADAHLQYLLSGGQWLSKDGGTTATYAEYTVNVPVEQDYTLWVRKSTDTRAVPPAPNNIVDINWRFDSDAMTSSVGAPQVGENTYIGAYWAHADWYNLGTIPSGNLTVGTHTFRFELQLTGEQAAFDCFVLAPTAFRPNFKVKPAQEVDLLVIALGMNDSTTPIANFEANIAGYVDDAEAAGMEVMLVSTMEPHPWEQQWQASDPGFVPKADTAAATVDVANAKNVGCADLYTEWVNWPTRGKPQYSELHNWNNHPGFEGHALYADVMLRFFDAPPTDPLNAAPVSAETAPTQLDLPGGTTVTLDGSGSTGATTYAWTQDGTTPTTVTLTGSDTDTATFTTTVAGTYTFTLTVGDGASGTDTSTITIVIWSVDAVASFSPNPVLDGGTVTLDATSSAGNVVGYDWQQTGGTGTATLSSTTAEQPTFVAGVDGETYAFTLTVDDGVGNTDTATVTVTVGVPVSSGGGGLSCARPVPGRSGSLPLAFFAVVLLAGVCVRRQRS